ncbi:MAG: GGDEF domain-containing protein, partial [Exilispira sp.]
IEKNFDKLSDKLKKLFLYARAEDYFSRYDHNNSIKTAKQAIRILCLDNNFDKSLYLPLLHRMSYSIIYSCDYKKAASYLKYFLMKAEQLKDIKYIFHSYNNLGVVNYRNKEFEKARKYMINALEYARQLEDKTLLFVSYNNLNLLEMDKKIRLQRSRKMLKLAPFLAEKTYLILSFCNIFLYLLEEGNFEEIFNIVSKYKDEIFQNFENYSFFTIRRFLHLYTILTFPFYIFEKKEYLNLFYKNLCTVKDKIEYQDEKFELKYLYNLIKPIIYYLINNESLENKSLTELKDKIKDIFIEYTEDKDKIVNTEFFTSLLGIYGLLFFEKSEYLNLIKELVKKYGKDSKVCNSDLSIFYRINTNNRYTDQTLMRYISIYFKLNDIEPWSSSGIFFKIYIFLFYLQILKNTKNIEKLKLYLQIFYRQFNPFLEFINTEFLFFPYIKENFSQMINLIEKINKSDKKRGENFSDYSISSFKNISLPKDGYDKDYFISLLSELTNHFGFDRGMLYLYENKEIRLKESICKQPILYHNFEPSYNFMENDYFYPQQPLFKKIKNSNISEILYLPIYFVNAIQRIASLEKYDKKNLQGVMLRGYFYFDSKTIKNRKLQYQTIQFCALYLSELFERIQLEKIYMNDYLTRVLTRENFFKKCYQVLNINKKSTIFAILMIDIDNFKKVNDNFGHQKGDIVLSKVAQTIKNSLRNIDIVGRYGGEEFTVCLMDTSMDNATIVAERIRTNIENLEFFDSNIKITVSIGLSFFPEDGMVIDELINKADIAMYRAKNKGKNRVEIYSN